AADTADRQADGAGRVGHRQVDDQAGFIIPVFGDEADVAWAEVDIATVGTADGGEVAAIVVDLGAGGAEAHAQVAGKIIGGDDDRWRDQDLLHGDIKPLYQVADLSEIMGGILHDLSVGARIYFDVAAFGQQRRLIVFK